jgi:ribulose-phosphate 3-epimerase
MTVQIAPSILSADFTEMGKAVNIAEEAGADLIHVDIMDGHFVPNLTFGPELVTFLKRITSLPLDVHLMVDNPRAMIPLFHDAGADWISIHVEASYHLHKDIMQIKDFGRKAGIVLNPATPIHLLHEIIQEVDFILLMSVNPGWGGQKFIASSYEKIFRLKGWLKEQQIDIPVEVDGGVNLDNMETLIKKGADILVAGSSIFKSEDPGKTIALMKEIASKAAAK